MRNKNNNRQPHPQWKWAIWTLGRGTKRRLRNVCSSFRPCRARSRTRATLTTQPAVRTKTQRRLFTSRADPLRIRMRHLRHTLTRGSDRHLRYNHLSPTSKASTSLLSQVQSDNLTLMLSSRTLIVQGEARPLRKAAWSIISIISSSQWL